MATSGLIQIAGIRNAAEARLLVAAGVDWLGFPFRLEYHAEDTTVEAAAEIIRELPETVSPVLITYLNQVEAILQLAEMLGVRHIHLHGHVSVDVLRELRRQRKDLFLIKSLVVKDNQVEELARAVAVYAPLVDAFITDTYDPRTGASGATGKTHDWRVSRRLVEISPRPIILAGGLNPENVEKAIEFVRPAGVDVHTGVEDSRGNKDPERVRRFVQNARRAFQKYPPLRGFSNE
ncbi:MAG: phosphoribosylanthranilate isomerase [Calditrichaeota bacterium]|nr:phosphoribosylanthranilate isomerase [Calditrichota bacterium]